MSDELWNSFLAQAPVEKLGRQPVVLEEGVLFVVLAGSLEIFLAPTSADSPPQARRFVLQRGAGEAALGVASQDGRGLVAIASRGTSMARLELRDCPRGPGSAFLIEAWVLALQAKISLGQAPPGRIRRVDALKLLKAPEGGCMTGFGESSVVWLPHREGSLELEGRWTTWQRSSLYFPLSKNVWLTVREKASLQPLSSLDWFVTDSVGNDLANFQTVALGRLLQLADDDLQTQCRRLQAKAEQSQAHLGATLRRLSSVLDSADDVSELEGGDPLVSAFARICRFLGATAPLAPGRGQDLESQVHAMARSSQLRVRTVRLRDQWWTGGGGPMLARLRDSVGAPVTLLSGPSGRYVLWDPASSAPLPVDAKVAATLEQDAYAFYRTFPSRVLRLRDLLRFALTGSSPDLATVIVVLLAAAGLTTLIPLLTGVLFGTIIPQSQPGQLVPLVLALVVGALASGCFEVTRSLAMLRFQGRSTGEVEAAVWDRVIQLPISFFRSYSAGNLANRAQALSAILQLLTGVAAGAVMGGIVSLANFALLFYLDPRLALTATGLVLVAIVVSLVGGYRNLVYGRALNDLESHLNGLVMQLLAGVGKLRSAGAEDRAFALWAHEFAEVRRFEVAQRKVSNWLTVFNSAYPLIAAMAIYATVAALGQEKVDTATFLAFNAAFGSFFAAFLSMGTSGLSLINAVPLFEQARPILRALPESDPSKLDPGELTGAIEFSHVSFGYSEDGPKVLHDLSFKIHPGEYVAVVGPSGAGKSTIARLMLGLDTPSSGSIFFDGQDLALLDTQALRRRIGVVLQNVQLLPGSILSAIVGNSTASGEDAWEAARMAGLEGDLKALPMGMQTWISEGGGTLSGGQKQRLTIARAIVSKPKILILDEATSALDNESQSTVTQSLSQLSATRIVIAHRLSTIRDADRILVMKDGAVVQQGSFAELSEQPGPFHELAKHQVFS